MISLIHVSVGRLFGEEFLRAALAGETGQMVYGNLVLITRAGGREDPEAHITSPGHGHKN